jgi:cell filamentation protein
MFDPFKDFETRGYLQNLYGEKNPQVVKEMEHELFRANLDDAISFLGTKRKITYADFLTVHKILFSTFYPWAGSDRTTTAPSVAIKKGDVLFCHPHDCRRAVEYGLQLGHDCKVLQARPGEVMGLFAYGHPFLDGNGRTMLVVHTELCNRAGFSISWEKSKKEDYLFSLTQEIRNPGQGFLDTYLRRFITTPVTREDWKKTIQELPGLNGISNDQQIDGDINDPAIVEKYQELEARRAYRIG